MKRKDLASLLGISPAMVTKLAGRGMPTTDAAAARAWRAQHLDLVRTKTYRTGGNDGGRRRRVPPAEGPSESAALAALARVAQLARLARPMLAAGQFGAVEADLRSALAAVPDPYRSRVLIDAATAEDPTPDAAELEPRSGHVAVPLAVWDALVAPVLRALSSGQVDDGEPVAMDDSEAAAMGAFWYAAAAGEVQATTKGASE